MSRRPRLVRPRKVKSPHRLVPERPKPKWEYLHTDMQTEAELIDNIRDEYALAEDGLQRTLTAAANCGELLIEAKRRVSHGQWLPWLEENFPGNPRTASRWMSLARARAEGELTIEPELSMAEALEVLKSLREPEKAPPEPAGCLTPEELEAPEGLGEELSEDVEELEPLAPEPEADAAEVVLTIHQRNELITRHVVALLGDCSPRNARRIGKHLILTIEALLEELDP